MESLIIWIVFGLIAAAVILPYAIRFRAMRRKDASAREEAVRLGADKAMAQHPHVDPFLCIGCGSCARACPEGKVLGIVNGKAALINGLKCVGHGLCAVACPTGALTVSLGDIKNRTDIPVLDEDNQSSIPGIYIAGELGGLALIHNAVSQGRQVVESMIHDFTPSPEAAYDVIVIGAGPAGISAALTALEHGLTCLVIDQQGAGGTILKYPRKKLVMVKPVILPLYGTLDRQEYLKEELLEIWEEIEKTHLKQMKIGEKLISVDRREGRFHVATQEDVYTASRVVLALGRRGTPRKLNVPGEELAKVTYQLMDAESYQNEHLLVVGGGDSAVEAAMALAMQEGNTVTLSYRKDTFFRIKSRNEERLEKMLHDKKLTVQFNSHVQKILPDSVVLKTEKGIRKIPNDYVFIFAGGEPPFGLMKRIGIRFGGEE